MSQEIKITIAGPSGSGKTSVGLAIYDFLGNLGFHVSLADADINPNGFTIEAARKLQGRRIEVLRDKTSININVATTRTRSFVSRKATSDE